MRPSTVAQRKTPAESIKPNPKRLNMLGFRAQFTDAQTPTQADTLAETTHPEEYSKARNKRLNMLRDDHKSRAETTDAGRPFQELEPLDRLEAIKSFKRAMPAKLLPGFVESLTLPERLRHPFRVMDLPAEVRTKIFEYALQDYPQHLTHVLLPPLT